MTINIRYNLVKNIKSIFQKNAGCILYWFRRWDLNPRHLGHEPSELAAALLRNIQTISNSYLKEFQGWSATYLIRFTSLFSTTSCLYILQSKFLRFQVLLYLLYLFFNSLGSSRIRVFRIDYSQLSSILIQNLSVRQTC